MVAGVLDAGLRFLGYGYLAKQLGPEAFGINSFMYTTTFLFGSLSDFGLRILGAREIASHPDKIEEQVSVTLSLKLALMVTAYMLMQVFVWLTRDSAQVRWLAAIYGLSLFGFNAADWILMGLEQMHYLGIARILNGVGVFALIVALVQGPEDLLLVGGIESFTFLLAGWFLLFVASRKVRIRLSFQIAEWKALLRETFPLGISLVMIRFGTSLPVFALALLSSDYEVGIYKAVGLLPGFLRRSTTMLSDVLLPTLSRIYAESEQYFARIMTWIQKYLAIGGILLSVLGIVLVGPLLVRVYGEEFRVGLGTFRILMIVSALVFSGQCLRRLLPACRAQRQYAFVMTFRTVALLILSLILARWGGEAEAWALLLTESGVLVLSIWFFQKQFPSTRIPATLFKVMIAGGAFVLVLWLLRANLFIAILVGVIVYGLMLVAFRVVSFADIKFIELKELTFLGTKKQPPH
jgi:O-antigen/teichoic acid export membrane protein